MIARLRARVEKLGEALGSKEKITIIVPGFETGPDGEPRIVPRRITCYQGGGRVSPEDMQKGDPPTVIDLTAGDYQP